MHIGRRIKEQVRALRRYRALQKSSQALPPVSSDPAFDPETAAWFRERIRRSQAYLEYGAGASTILAAQAGVPSVSIESHADYAQSVSDSLPEGSGRRHVVRAIDIGTTEEWGTPLWILPYPGRRRKWESYPAAGPANLECLPRFPDLVLVDGRFRVACALAMALAAKDRNQDFDLLFDDYDLRPHYAVVERYLPAPTAIGRSRLFSVRGSEIDRARVAASFRAAVDDYR